VKGAIILYHGFSACPDSFQYISEQLTKSGFVVIAPLLPGQGIKLGYGCNVKGVCVKNNTNPSFLPDKKEGYMQWTDWSLEMLREEVSQIPVSSRASGFFVGTLGLSAGGPLGTYAASRPNTPLSKILLVNPYYTFSSPAFDINVVACRAQPDPSKCMVKTILPKLESGDSAESHRANDYSQMYVGPFEVAFKGLQRSVKSFGAFLAERTVGGLLVNAYDKLLHAVWGAVRSSMDEGLLVRVQLLTR
jgi:alpha-beta hydrolase superfamily lysophospholipase